MLWCVARDVGITIDKKRLTVLWIIRLRGKLVLALVDELVLNYFFLIERGVHPRVQMLLYDFSVDLAAGNGVWLCHRRVETGLEAKLRDFLLR